MKIESHPTVRRYRERQGQGEQQTTTVDRQWLQQAFLEAGADDAGVVSLDHPLLEEEQERVASLFAEARTLVCLVVRLNPDALRSLSRATSDMEYLHGMKKVDAIARAVLKRLHQRGMRAVAPPSAFPMDQEHWPERTWPVAHKLVAEAAGLGKRGLHRLFVHRRFGAAVVLGTLALEAEVTGDEEPRDSFDPCLQCKLCVAVCPVGAVASDGAFTGVNCLTHNYRDRLQGFSYWIEQVVQSRSAQDYRRRIPDAETIAMWQGLTYGVSNKCSYCMAVCPAGDEQIGAWIDNKKDFLAQVVKPLKQRPEKIFVVPGSDGEAHAQRKFSHKELRRVGSGIRPRTVPGFVEALPLVFNRNQAEGLDATYHLTFTGAEPLEATVVIRDKTMAVAPGHEGEPDLRLFADSATWLGLMAKEKGMFWAVVSGKVKVKGPMALIKAFAACFPL